MGRLSHEQAQELAAQLESNESIADFDRLRLELHLEACEPCATRHHRVQGLVHALRQRAIPAPQKSDRQLIAQAVMQAGSGARKMPKLDWPRPPVLWAAAACTALALGLASAWSVQPTSEPEPQAARSATPPPAPEHETPPQVATRVTPPRETAAQPPRVLAGAAALSPCRGVRTEWEREAELQVRASDDAVCRLAMAEGALRVHVDPAAGVQVSIETPTATVRVLGTVFRISVGEAGTSVAVYRGEVMVDAPTGIQKVAPGQALRQRGRADNRLVVNEAASDTLARLASFAGDEAPPRSNPVANAKRQRSRAEPKVDDLRKLLSSGRAAQARDEARSRSARPEYAGNQPELLTIIAESYVMEGQHQRALRVYRRVADGPPSSTAANALMAAANVNLERTGNAQAALRLYERYIEEYPQGSLSEVAAIGRCRALQHGGDRQQATSCARAYLDDHPAGRFERQMRALAD